MKSLFAILIFSSFFKLSAQELPTVIIMVRHAEKVNNLEADPGISETGRKQAKCLGKLLSLEKINTIYSTPFNRSRETATEIASFQNSEVKEYNPFNENVIKEVVELHKGETILLVGHSNTIPLYLNDLMGKGTFKQMREDEYDKIFIVIKRSEELPTLLTLSLACADE